ncbi:protein disulfide-isomerase TMX3-like isoform X2 [Hypomesus transpacificus]|uniref:protein disulfide-isomerase TMX3-like isoform X2 n=1 Tax=Hypomesus transpacificus TaxID=137520 RepID=UPI001F080047|nr:protein disulfide-isomerase TMX3-like isoform X2 [Hypomesus transpacificus]
MAFIKCQVICTVLLTVSAVSGYVVELDDTFTETKGEDIWLIKFYAPWCTFCKELSPVWHEVAAELKSMGSEVNVGRADASTQTSLVKVFRVGGYPAIKMLKDDVKYNYQGPRTKDGILDFATRVSGPLVRPLTTPQLFQHALSRHNVLFVYVGGASLLKTDYVSSAKELIVHTYFFSASRDVLPKGVTIHPLPAVVVFKEGTFYTYDSKLVVLALVDEKKRSQYSICYKTMVEKVSREYKELYRSELQFGYMEGKDYIDGFIMGEVAIPSIIILNLSNDGYFLPPDEVQTEEQLVQFINGVLDGSFKSQGGNGLFQRFQRFVYNTKLTVMPIYTKAPILIFFVLIMFMSGFVIMFYFLYTCCCSSEKDEEELSSGAKSEADKKAD